MSGAAPPLPQGDRGVRIIGTGSSFPKRVMTNSDLERVMDTSDEWIVQRTGIRRRHVYEHEAGESTFSLATDALRVALADAGVAPAELDHILVATMTGDMPTPSVSCRLADAIGCGPVGAVDLNGACCGFVFALNYAHALVKTGMARTIAVVGADTITRYVEFTTRGRNGAILFGDGASAMILRADPDPRLGVIAQSMHSDGGRACHLFIPAEADQYPEQQDPDDRMLGLLHMNGQAVFKFAVTKFPEVIEETLGIASLRANEVDHYVCHQANTRILESARERFGLDPARLPINIDRYGNTVAASVPLLFDEIRRAGQVKGGQRVMFLAFGAGLTWGSSLWQL